MSKNLYEDGFKVCLSVDRPVYRLLENSYWPQASMNNALSVVWFDGLSSTQMRKYGRPDPRNLNESRIDFLLSWTRGSDLQI